MGSSAAGERGGRDPMGSSAAGDRGERDPMSSSAAEDRAGRDPMSSSGPVAGRAPRKRAASTRVIGVWRDLPYERRLAVMAAFALFLTLFLPWYQETVIAGGVKSLQSVSESLSGWAAFSFVEAAVLLVAAAVLLMLFVRAEGAAFHVPGGDGGVITAAGVWTCALIVWRIFDKEGTTGHGQFATTSGIEWGIFVALGVAAFLTYAGTRIRLAHEPEPPLPGERPRASAQARTGGGFWRRRKGGDKGGERRPRTAQSAPRAQRGPQMDVDDAWSDAPVARRARPAPPRERQPSRADESWQYDEPPLGEADTRVMPSARPPAAEANQPRQPAFEASQPPQPASAPTEPTAPWRRVRPRSVSAPEPPRPQGEGPAGGGQPAGRSEQPDSGERPTASGRPDAGERSDRGERPGRGERGRRSRGLDRREIQDLEISEPPTARLGRAGRKPAPQSEPTVERRPRRQETEPESEPEPDDAGDQLTIRLDRPN
jgi:hypothetical protein